jgi:hypothetical protein
MNRERGRYLCLRLTARLFASTLSGMAWRAGMLLRSAFFGKLFALPGRYTEQMVPLRVARPRESRSVVLRLPALRSAPVRPAFLALSVAWPGRSLRLTD